MLNLFKRNKAHINSLTFPDFDWTETHNDKTMKQWVNTEQTMALSVNYFGKTPDLPSVQDLDTIRNYYRDQIIAAGGGLLEVDFTQLHGFKVLKTIFKVPQTPDGMIYLTSLTIPFKNCSFVIKIQGQETGATAMRETMVAHKLVTEGKLKSDENGYIDWSHDPYDPNLGIGARMNLSEDKKYDHQYPKHPLSISRKMMAEIEQSVTFEDDIKNMKAYYR